MGDKGIDDDKKIRQKDDDFDRHAARAIRGGAHRPMKRSVASCKAIRCCHRVSTRTILPRRPPWSMILNVKKKH
jgi:hypothetical protein